MMLALKPFHRSLVLAGALAFSSGANPSIEIFSEGPKAATQRILERLGNTAEYNQFRSTLNLAEAYFAARPDAGEDFLQQVYTAAEHRAKGKDDLELARKRRKVFEQGDWKLKESRPMLDRIRALDADADHVKRLDRFEAEAVARWNSLYMAALRAQKAGSTDSLLYFVLGKAQFRMSFSGKEELKNFLARGNAPAGLRKEAQALLKSIEIHERN